MKKHLFLLLLLGVAIALPAENIFTEKIFRGHLQGLVADTSGIYCAFAYEMAKFDFNGKVICRTPAPFHSGDITACGKKFYCSVTLHDAALIKKYGARSCLFVYDRNLKLLEVIPLKQLAAIDGIAYLNGKFYVALNEHGSERHMENRIAILDKNFKVLKIATVSINRLTRYGVQTLNPFRGKLLGGFYGGGGNSFVFDPDQLANSDTTVCPIDSIPANTSVGFSECQPPSPQRAPLSSPATPVQKIPFPNGGNTV